MFRPRDGFCLDVLLRERGKADKGTCETERGGEQDGCVVYCLLSADMHECMHVFGYFVCLGWIICWMDI